MQLRQIGPEDVQAFLSYAADFEEDNRNRLVRTPEDFGDFLRSLDDFANGRNLKPGYVPSRSYFGFQGHDMIGRVTYRPDLNERTIIEGGHIGYEVRLSKRGKGLATQMLACFLSSPFLVPTDRVLITCDVENRASEGVIVKNGGVLESIAHSPRTGKPTKRFWIELGERGKPELS